MLREDGHLSPHLLLGEKGSEHSAFYFSGIVDHYCPASESHAPIIVKVVLTVAGPHGDSALCTRFDRSDLSYDNLWVSTTKGRK